MGIIQNIRFDVVPRGRGYAEKLLHDLDIWDARERCTAKPKANGGVRFIRRLCYVD